MPCGALVVNLFAVHRSKRNAQRRFVRFSLFWIRVFLCAVILLPGTCEFSWAGDVIFVESPSRSSQNTKTLETAARFYGLRLEAISPGKDGNDSKILLALRRHDTVAAVISADALAFLDQTRVFSALGRPSRGSVPLLIVDLMPTTTSSLLAKWSGGAVVSCDTWANSSVRLHIAPGISSITGPLADQTLPLPNGKVYRLSLDPTQKAQTLAEVQTRDGPQSIFVKARDGQQEVFILAALPSPDAPQAPDQLLDFSEIAPAMMFIRHCAGERAWHTPSQYANLTIDDAWLTEPYGNLNYAGLLQEMQKANFHTTIAFVPWNFDRSQPGVVSLFKKHPDRYSICVHGDNHDHQEFYDYTTNPLVDQVAAIKQAIARMERFKALTGIPYDRVMSWPHEVVPPVPTLAALKEYNFLADVNADVVPLGLKRPDDPQFALRSGSTLFADFLTIKRLPASVRSAHSQIAVDSFLGNPILFYAHQDFFAADNGAFDDTARLVNRIQPETIWTSLGEVARHFYLLRRRDDENYDVKAFSSELSLRNPGSHDATFFVEKDGPCSTPISSVTVDGRPYPYDCSNGKLSFKVMVQAAQSSEAVISYQNDLSTASINVSKPSFRINALRRLSDFRDMTLSRYSLGRNFIGFYDVKLARLEFPLESDVPSAATYFCVLLIIVAGGWGLALHMKRRRQRPTPGVRQQPH